MNSLRLVCAAAILTIATASAAEVSARAGRMLPAPPDPRQTILHDFFDRYHCAKPYPIAAYLHAADRYGLDYRVLPAISIRETGCGKAAGPANNYWGFHHENFATLTAGIDFMTRRLTQHPLYQLKTLVDKLFVYNPRKAYPGEIIRIMHQIAGD